MLIAVLWLGGPATLPGTCASFRGILRRLLRLLRRRRWGFIGGRHWGRWGVHPGRSPPRFGRRFNEAVDVCRPRLVSTSTMNLLVQPCCTEYGVITISLDLILVGGIRIFPIT